MNFKNYRPDEIIKNYFLSTKYCMKNNHQCKGPIIDAHTISKKYLKFVSENNHIYYPKISLFNKKSLYQFEENGINKSSTFLGFCEHHDKVLFSSFENNIYSGDFRQIFDFSFRVLAREYFQKKCLLKYCDKILHGKIPSSHDLTMEKREFFQKAKILSARHVREHRNLYDKFKFHEKNKLNYIQIKLSRIPIGTTGVLFPFQNCKGEILQIESQAQRGIIYYLLPVEDYSYIVFSFPAVSKDNFIEKNFTNSIIEFIQLYPEYCADYLLTTFLYTNDIVAIDPKWFQQIGPDLQTELNNLMNLQAGNYFSSHPLIEPSNFHEHLKIELIDIIKKHH